MSQDGRGGGDLQLMVDVLRLPAVVVAARDAQWYCVYAKLRQKIACER